MRSFLYCLRQFCPLLNFLNGETSRSRRRISHTLTSPQKMTRPTFIVPVTLFGLALPSFAEDKVTYADHARAVMENKCFSCHNPDKKRTDPTTFAGVMAGGGGGSIVDPGNPDNSKPIGNRAQVD